MSGFDEIAQSLDGAVHDLREQHRRGDDDDQDQILSLATTAAVRTSKEKTSFQVTLKSLITALAAAARGRLRPSTRREHGPAPMPSSDAPSLWRGAIEGRPCAAAATPPPLPPHPPRPDAFNQPVQAPQRLAQPVRRELLPLLAVTVVGSKLKLHDGGLESLR